MENKIDYVKVKNIQLKEIYDFFYNIPLNGIKSRHRTKFLKNIEKSSTEYNEDRKSLINEFALRDENGNIVLSEDKKQVQINIEDFPNAIEEIQSLDNEYSLVEVKSKSILLDIIDNIEIQISKETAILIDTLAEQLEE